MAPTALWAFDALASAVDGVSALSPVANGGARRLIAKTAGKAVPGLILGAVIPAVCFLLGHHVWGLIGAIALTLAWSSLYQAFRWLRGQSLSGLALLGLVELSLRTAVALALHSAQLFFIAPAVVTAVTAGVFVGSGLGSKPLLARVVGELVPQSVLDLRDPRAARMLNRVSVLYGAEQFAIAVISVAMVLNMSTSAYVATHTVVSWLVLGIATTAAAPFFRAELQAIIRSEPPPLAVS
jgi:intracellular septation protein A